MTTIPPIRHVSFLHLDLGIGGAEQLIVQLATVTQQIQVQQQAQEQGQEQQSQTSNASSTQSNTIRKNDNDKSTNISVSIYTTRCEPHHCFRAVQPGGVLHDSLKVYGSWLPHYLLGHRLRVLCSTIRLLYLSVVLIVRVAMKWEATPDVVVVDVLPVPLLVLQWLLPSTSLLFYCHFPDALLKQRENQVEQDSSRLTSSKTRLFHALRSLYRSIMFAFEQACMRCADRIVVNSLFTQHIVRNTFDKLSDTHLPVLYPALDVSKNNDVTADATKQKHYRLVSLNRYERKKNIGLLLEAVAWIRDHDATLKLPEIYICGGYDTKCVENVEHRAELEQLAKSLQLHHVTTFRQSVSDVERANLLETALAVIYTPSDEHFGIVPLEAMYAQTPVVAVNNGGPKESVLDGTTGFLCDNTPESFGRAIIKLLQDPDLAVRMGRAGRNHVVNTFGMDRMLDEWATLLQETHALGWHRRRGKQYKVARGVVYVLEAAVMLLLVWLLTVVLRKLAVLEADQSILGRIVRGSGKDEL
ncbi:hypothetical protein MPSEU_000586200 [Mayamaea pseudoterrestris]|nr:hypothetical protein MPSEU_000586200 [Mayamaea pseudoterrestris]